jgi:nucleoside-diphosphate kinase
VERSLVLLKPDALARGLVGKIIQRIEEKGLKIVAMKMLWMDKEMAKRHYEPHVGKPFYHDLEKFITSLPVIAMVVEGKEAVAVMRKLAGATNGRNAEPGTIRGDFSMSVSRNLIHASDSKENAQREIAIFFNENEIYSWNREKFFLYAEDE